MVGEKIRQARQAQRLSLIQVAEKAEVSAATLSRIETNKQGLDMELFLRIAEVLQIAPDLLIGDEGPDDGRDDRDDLVDQVASLPASERTRLWREVAATRKSSRVARRAAGRELASQVEELLAQIDFIREEMDSVRRRLRKR